MAARPPAVAGPNRPPSTTVPPEPAEIGRVASAMSRLALALDAYIAGHADPRFPPFRAVAGSTLTGPLPDYGVGADEAIDGLAAVTVDGSRIGAPGFTGFITTGASTVPDSWVHVDGAYGLVAQASPALRHLFAGIEDADSWIVDPHKWLATGVGIGAAYVRDEGVLTRAFAEGDAAYLEGSLREDTSGARSQFDAMGGRWADQSVDLSAPPRGVVVWALLREIGRAGVAARVERHVAFAREVADRTSAHPRLELLMEPQLSIACFRHRPTGAMVDEAGVDDLNRRILDRLRRETATVPSSTVLDGRFAIRPCFINPRTTEREVTSLVDAVIRFGDELTGA